MKQTIRTLTSRLACFLVAAVLLTAGASRIHAALYATVQADNRAAVAGATITSDKPDYHPGEIVTLTGSGWNPGELVTIVMAVDPITHKDVTLTSLADANGQFKNSNYLVQQSDLGVTFHVLATGASGDVAPLLTFTDSIGAPAAIGNNGLSGGSNVTTLTVTVTSTVPVGNTVIFTFVGAISSGSSVTIADSSGNAYTNDADVTNSAPTRTIIWSAPVTAGLSNGSTITVTFPRQRLQANASAFSVSGLIGTGRVDKTATNNNGSGTSATVGPTAATTQAGELVFGAFGMDISSGSPTFAATGGSTALQTNVISGSWGIYPEYKIVSATGTQTATGTFSGGVADYSAALVTYKAAASQLAFSTAPVSVNTGVCSPQITVQSQDSGGNAASPTSTETVALSTSGTGGTFYSNATCTASITSVTIANTANSASFYWADTTAGSPVITASGTGAFTSAPTQTETVTTLTNPVPSISSLSPTSAVVGTAAQTLTINGTNFVATSSATYNGVAHAVTFVSAAQVKIQLSLADQSVVGSFPVVVTNPAPGGGSSNAVNFIVGNPVPAITTLSPSPVIAGAAAQTLTINGSNFLASSTVTFNSTGRTAAFVNAGQLTIQLTSADQATAGSYPVVVTNPTPGGGSSNTVNFAVNNPLPAISTLSPASAVTGNPAQTLTINGSNFLSTSTVTYAGTAHTATFVNAGQLTISLTAGDQATAGSFPVVVTNAAPGGGSSTAVNFVVNKDATTTTITNAAALGTASNVGQAYPVTFTVVANAPGSGTPTGTVTVSDGSVTCTASVATGNCSLTSLTVGTKTITASYPGDSNYVASVSGGVSHVVNIGSSSTALTSNANPSVNGQPVTFTATVTPLPTVGDVVTFNDNGSSIGTGTTNASGWLRSRLLRWLSALTPSPRCFLGTLILVAARRRRFLRWSIRPARPLRSLPTYLPLQLSDSLTLLHLR